MFISSQSGQFFPVQSTQLAPTGQGQPGFIAASGQSMGGSVVTPSFSSVPNSTFSGMFSSGMPSLPVQGGMFGQQSFPQPAATPGFAVMLPSLTTSNGPGSPTFFQQATQSQQGPFPGMSQGLTNTGNSMFSTGMIGGQSFAAQQPVFPQQAFQQPFMAQQPPIFNINLGNSALMPNQAPVTAQVPVPTAQNQFTIPPGYALLLPQSMLTQPLQPTRSQQNLQEAQTLLQQVSQPVGQMSGQSPGQAFGQSFGQPPVFNFNLGGAAGSGTFGLSSQPQGMVMPQQQTTPSLSASGMSLPPVFNFIMGQPGSATVSPTGSPLPASQTTPLLPAAGFPQNPALPGSGQPVFNFLYAGLPNVTTSANPPQQLAPGSLPATGSPTPSGVNFNFYVNGLNAAGLSNLSPTAGLPLIPSSPSTGGGLSQPISSPSTTAIWPDFQTLADISRQEVVTSFPASRPSGTGGTDTGILQSLILLLGFLISRK